MTVPAPLSSVRIVECSMLGPGAITTTLADLGAEEWRSRCSLTVA